jgi:hypothetical protein
VYTDSQITLKNGTKPEDTHAPHRTNQDQGLRNGM